MDLLREHGPELESMRFLLTISIEFDKEVQVRPDRVSFDLGFQDGEDLEWEMSKRRKSKKMYVVDEEKTTFRAPDYTIICD